MEEETKKAKQPKDKNLAIPVLLVGLLLAVAWGVYGFVDADNKSDEVSELSSKVSQLETAATQQDTNTEEELPANNAATTTNDAVQPVDKPIVEPAVVFEPGGLFDDATRAELQTKLIKPFTAYNQDEGTNPVSIQITAPDTTPGEWIVFAIFGDDKYSGFLYGNDGQATQDWWYPECFEGSCEFSPEFSANYPEVVTAAGS